MSQQGKLIAKFLNARTFRWPELARMLKGLGYSEIQGEGSRVKFVKADRVISLHRPHPLPELKSYALRQVRESLREWDEL